MQANGVDTMSLVTAMYPVRDPQVLGSTSVAMRIGCSLCHFPIIRYIEPSLKTLWLVLRKLEDQDAWKSWVYPRQGQCQWPWASCQSCQRGTGSWGKDWPKGLLERHWTEITLGKKRVSWKVGLYVPHSL